MSQSEMSLRPVRANLVDQVVSCLRQRIDDGQWKKHLPSESELCKDLGVSRGTLRRALGTLFDEGVLVQGGRGAHHEVAANYLPTQSKVTTVRKDLQLIRVLSPHPRFIIGGQTQVILQVVSEAVGRAGYHLEFDYHPGLWDLNSPASNLSRITRCEKTAAWLLYRPNKQIQQWFSKCGIPAVAIGDVFPDVVLSHAGFDLPAACRHAVGLFSARGRKNLAFLTVTKSTAGDLACVDAFRKACMQAGLRPFCLEYEDTIESLCRVIDSLLEQNPRPDGYLVAFANHVPATIGHLNRRGCQVPQDAAVISRLDARLLAESIPSIARYEADEERLGRYLGRLLVQEIESEHKGVPRSHWVMPEFVDGESAISC
ncbi:substrate-binding domain-containing protein [Roseibacillus ishigakijimensis]|uniref:Substrate-binding domain-containing protein n=1 Tax=Roseibacillus ishigakijimensis TaxID=454146 RepID=A0A934RQ14_9BACT|nr:substrate-binding domain-containing protein [Roseibacillus ishigakijimensis]MBK1833742.1 substrate-binding domain-containing protein [Roseibacillus ishigakijimensis]